MRTIATVVGLALLSACSDNEEAQPVEPEAPSQAETVNEPLGVVDISGRSPFLGDVSYQFKGSVTAASGAPTVSCAYYPEGNELANVPEIVIEAGFAQETSSMEVHLFDSLTNVGESAVPDETLATLSLRTRLTYDDPASFNEYELGSEDGVVSYCEVEIYERSLYLSGRVSCRDLFATPASADFGNGSAVLASVALDFTCPLSSLGQSGEFLGTGGTGDSAPATGGMSSGDDDPTASGGGASTGTCGGYVTACSLLGSSSCLLTDGCSREEECEGTPSSCYNQFYSFSCYSQDGCVWSSYNDSCSGFARSCSSMSGSSSCVGQSGCRWSDDCTGVAKSCSSYVSALTCEGQPGCSWTED